jgi:hypothetical protein
MYCPLCAAEYRRGFTECSDCHIALVATQAEANQVKTAQLSTDDGSVLNALRDSLADEKIPFRQRVAFRPLAVEPKPASEFRIDISAQDSVPAREILDQVTTVEPLD